MLKNINNPKSYSRLIIYLVIFLGTLNSPIWGFNIFNTINRNHIQKIVQKNKSKKLIAEINWETYKHTERDSKAINWELEKEQAIPPSKQKWERDDSDSIEIHSHVNLNSISSLNRSIVFNNDITGPDISWIVPSGFSWNKKYKFDVHVRGHNTKIPEPQKRKFFGWNDGDAVGLISYQFIHTPKTSFGLNAGIRSVYSGKQHLGGGSNIGEGLSGGFRWDRKLSETSGIAFGAEQLVHFDNKTDTGRNIYITASKAWWSSEYEGVGIFPLYTATGGFATGRMAVGTIRGLCSNSLNGSGTEIETVRNLCWAPVFSLAKVYNEKFSTFFEYNSRFFLLGSSLAPSQKIPLRGTLALILSDHVDNYKLHNFSELNWVFNFSIGF